MKRFLQFCGITLGLGLLSVVLSALLPSTPVNAKAQDALSAAATAVPQPVIVMNTNPNPVFVQDVDNPARQPFAVSLCASGGNYTCGQGETATFTTATGEHTVIEQVSGICYTDGNQTFLPALDATIAGVPYTMTYLPLSTSPPIPPQNVNIPVSQTRLYPDAGTVVQLLYPVAGGNGNFNCYVSLVGYTQRP
jgi:hypothetical protein